MKVNLACTMSLRTGWAAETISKNLFKKTNKLGICAFLLSFQDARAKDNQREADRLEKEHQVCLLMAPAWEPK